MRVRSDRVRPGEACLCAKPLQSGRWYMSFGQQCRLCNKIIVSSAHKARLELMAEHQRIQDARRNRARAKGGLAPE